MLNALLTIVDPFFCKSILDRLEKDKITVCRLCIIKSFRYKVEMINKNFKDTLACSRHSSNIY